MSEISFCLLLFLCAVSAQPSNSTNLPPPGLGGILPSASKTTLAVSGTLLGIMCFVELVLVVMVCSSTQTWKPDPVRMGPCKMGRDFCCGPYSEVPRFLLWMLLFIFGAVGAGLLVVGASEYERYSGIVVPSTCKIEATQQYSSTCQECSKTGCRQVTCYKGSIFTSCCGFCRHAHCFEAIIFVIADVFSFAAHAFQVSGLMCAPLPPLRQLRNACKTIRLTRCSTVCTGLMTV